LEHQRSKQSPFVFAIAESEIGLPPSVTTISGCALDAPQLTLECFITYWNFCACELKAEQASVPCAQLCSHGGRYRGRIALIEQHKMLGHVINLPSPSSSGTSSGDPFFISPPPPNLLDPVPFWS
jgi:hypothetical protein